MNTPINIAVIGLGNMGRHHARHLAAMDNVELVAVCDANPDTAIDFGQQYQCSWYTDWNALLAHPRLDAVSIITPTSLHHAIAKQSLLTGLHTLVEKPICTTLDEADELVKLSHDTNKPLMVGHIERFNPTITSLKTLIDTNAIGRIIHVYAHRASPMPPQIKDANVGLDLAVHDIDLCQFLMGSAATTVHRQSGHGQLTDRDDYASYFLTYPQGAATVHVNWVSPIRIREILVTGTTGYAIADSMNKTLRYWTNDTPQDIPISDTDALASELAHFITCIRQSSSPLVDAQVGRDVLAAIIGE